MAKKESAKVGAATEARALCDFWTGERWARANEVLTLDAPTLAAFKAAGWIDDHPAAVEYAKGL